MPLVEGTSMGPPGFGPQGGFGRPQGQVESGSARASARRSEALPDLLLDAPEAVLAPGRVVGLARGAEQPEARHAPEPEREELKAVGLELGLPAVAVEVHL